MTHHFDQTAIESVIPHRYENVLIDSCDADLDSGSGSCTIEIASGDPAGRDLFYAKYSDQESVMLAPFFMEILALSSIVCSNLDPDGGLVIYAAISNFKKLGYAPLGTPMIASAKKISDKAGFYKYSGAINTADGTPVVTGNMMAYHYTDDRSEVRSASPPYRLPESAEPLSPPSYKDKSLWVADAVLNFNPDTGDCQCAYTYPPTHPLIRGHFPDWPVMMGVMQWMSVSDVCYVIAEKQDLSGTYDLSGDATLRDPSGEVVCEIKGFTVRSFRNVDGIVDHTEITETRKISFRSIIGPGDTLIISVTPKSICPV